MWRRRRVHADRSDVNVDDKSSQQQQQQFKPITTISSPYREQTQHNKKGQMIGDIKSKTITPPQQDNHK
jgi:hypothetical protein